MDIDIASGGRELHTPLAEPVSDLLVDGLALRLSAQFAHHRSVDLEFIDLLVGIGVARDDHIRGSRSGRAVVDSHGAVSCDEKDCLNLFHSSSPIYPFFFRGPFKNRDFPKKRYCDLGPVLPSVKHTRRLMRLTLGKRCKRVVKYDFSLRVKVLYSTFREYTYILSHFC